MSLVRTVRNLLAGNGGLTVNGTIQTITTVNNVTLNATTSFSGIATLTGGTMTLPVAADSRTESHIAVCTSAQFTAAGT